MRSSQYGPPHHELRHHCIVGTPAGSPYSGFALSQENGLLTDFSVAFQSIDQAVEMIRHFLSEIIYILTDPRFLQLTWLEVKNGRYGMAQTMELALQVTVKIG